MNHLEKAGRWLREPGVEIGAFKTPIPGIAPVYVDKFAEFANEPCLADYYGEATALPFRDRTLRYVASSHVLEHVANPVLALEEWCRVLRPGGVIYLVVPDKRYTWDRDRATTPVAHLLEDYARGTTACDGTHIADFVEKVDWATFSPGTPPEAVAAKQAELRASYEHAVGTGHEINIHFHVFEPASVLELAGTLARLHPARFDWEVVDQAERFPSDNPNGFFVALRRRERWLDSLGNRWRSRRHRRNPQSILRADARPFAAS